MTTILIKGGLLACDSRLTRGHHVLTDRALKARPLTKDRGMLAVCGLFADVSHFVAAFKKGGPQFAKMDEETDIIWARPNGTVRVWQYFNHQLGHYDLSVPPEGLAFGSGNAYARGALMAGATLREAVAIAARGDVNTGGEINVYSIATGLRI